MTYYILLVLGLAAIVVFAPTTDRFGEYIPVNATVRVEKRYAGEIAPGMRPTPVHTYTREHAYEFQGDYYEGIAQDASRDGDRSTEVVVYVNPRNPVEFVVSRARYPSSFQGWLALSVLIIGCALAPKVYRRADHWQTDRRARRGKL